MNKEEILSLPAGPRMDYLLAEYIMGYQVKGEVVIFPDGDHSYLVPDLGGHWSPSHDISLAMQVSDKIGELLAHDDSLVIEAGMNYLTLSQLGTYVENRFAASFDCIYDDDEWFDPGHIEQYQYAARGETAALAICRAALLTVVSKIVTVEKEN